MSPAQWRARRRTTDEYAMEQITIEDEAEVIAASPWLLAFREELLGGASTRLGGRNAGGMFFDVMALRERRVEPARGGGSRWEYPCGWGLAL